MERVRERERESERETHKAFLTHRHWSIKGRLDIPPCACHVEHLFDWLLNRMNAEKRETQRERERDIEEERETERTREKERSPPI